MKALSAAIGGGAIASCRMLNLSCNRIGDEGAKALRDAFRGREGFKLYV